MRPLRTLTDLAEYGIMLRIACRHCGHHESFSADTLIKRGAPIDVPFNALKARCQMCGSTDASFATYDARPPE